jgi:hypothetical protein
MEYNDKFFGVRLRAMIDDKKETVAEFAVNYGIGESQAFNWVKLQKPPPAKHWSKLSKYFGVSEHYLVTGIASPEPFGLVEETPAEYRKSGSLEAGGIIRRPASNAPMLNPRHAPRPPEPTPQQCLDHFHAYLKQAEHRTGGLGHTWIELQKHFPLESIAANDAP